MVLLRGGYDTSCGASSSLGVFTTSLDQTLGLYGSGCEYPSGKLFLGSRRGDSNKGGQHAFGLRFVYSTHPQIEYASVPTPEGNTCGA